MTDATLPLSGGPAPQPAAVALDRGEALWRRHMAAFFSSPSAVFGFVLLMILVALALFAPLITPQNPYDLRQLDIMDGTLPPGAKMGAGFTAWLGTDEQGRDMLSGIIYGLRVLRSKFLVFIPRLPRPTTDRRLADPQPVVVPKIADQGALDSPTEQPTRGRS